MQREKWKPGPCNCGREGGLSVLITEERWDRRVQFHRRNCPACPRAVCERASDKEGCHRGYRHMCCVVCGDGKRVRRNEANGTFENVCWECIYSANGIDPLFCPNLVYAKQAYLEGDTLCSEKEKSFTRKAIKPEQSVAP